MSKATQRVSGGSQGQTQAIRIVSHSLLIYWWPVWGVGFLLALLTYLDGHRMALVPANTVAEARRQVEGHEGPRDVLVAPPGSSLPVDRMTGELRQPSLRLATNKNYGILFVLTLCLVIFITDVHLRGLWSVIVLGFLVLLAVLFAWLDWWDEIIRFVDVLQVHINALGYLLIAGIVFVFWLVAFFVFDPQVYAVFSRGQLRMRLDVGGAESVYDAMGMMIHKKRDDLFRHWILGLGSGDLLVKTRGPSGQLFDMPNVLFVGRKVKLIQLMMQEREVVSAKPG